MALHSNRRKLRFFLQEHLGKINGYGDNMLDFYISKKTVKTFKGLNVHAFSECFDLILQKMFFFDTRHVKGFSEEKIKSFFTERK